MSAFSYSFHLSIHCVGCYVLYTSLLVYTSRVYQYIYMCYTGQCLCLSWPLFKCFNEPAVKWVVSTL